MKKFILSLSFMFAFVLTGQAMDFYDEDDFPSWSAEAIEVVETAGVMRGFGDGTFRPKQALNRAEAVTLLLRVKGLEDEKPKQNSSFADVPEGAWFAKAVGLAEDNGWLTGKADGLFHPADSLNRAEFAALVHRAFEVQSKDRTVLPFRDITTDVWFYEPVKALFDRELLRNARNNDFRAGTIVTRAEAAWTFAQILEKPGILNGAAVTAESRSNARRPAVKPRDFDPNQQGYNILKKAVWLFAAPVNDNVEIVKAAPEWQVVGSVRLDSNLDARANLESLKLKVRFEENGVGPEEHFEARLTGPNDYEKIVPVGSGGETLFSGLGIPLDEGDKVDYWVSYRALPDRTYFPTDGTATVVLNEADGLYFKAFTGENDSRSAEVRPVPVGFGDRLIGSFDFKINP